MIICSHDLFAMAQFLVRYRGVLIIVKADTFVQYKLIH